MFKLQITTSPSSPSSPSSSYSSSSCSQYCHILPILITVTLVLPLCCPYSSPIAVDTTSTATITNFKQDLGACSCNITTACDTFCCCDQICSVEDRTKWALQNWCEQTAVQIQKYCENIGSKGYSTFQDMGCVIFSNRNAIGQFYDLPTSNNIIDPNTAKFSSHNTNAQSISPNTVVTSSIYQQNSAIKIYSTTTSINNSPLLYYTSSIGSVCRQQSVAIKQGVYSYQCYYSIVNQASCQQINSIIIANNTGVGLSVCEYGNCSSGVPGSSAFTVNAATYTASTSTCSNYINKLQISAQINYVNNQYHITSFTLTPTYSATAVTVNNKIIITTVISISKTGGIVSKSGNPGYIVGKKLIYSTGNIYQFYNSNTKVCLTNTQASTAISANTLPQLNIKFGINQTYYCLTTLTSTSNICTSANALYIDQIARALSYKLSKYASGSNQSIDISGMAETACNSQHFIFNILYSYSGWILQPQYYIIGATVTGSGGIGNAIGTTVMKMFSVKWILVEPTSIVAPPSNYFYTYFEKLWLPLKGMYYGTSFQGNIRVGVIAIFVGFAMIVGNDIF